MELKIKYKIWLEDEKGRYIIGPGGAELLEAIKEYGSISAAAEHLGMSYDYAWRLLKRIEKSLGKKIISTRIGGARGGGSTLTPEGEKLLDIYKKAKEKMEKTLYG